MERALITGAAGFFGAALVRGFAEAGIEVLATDLIDLSDYAPRPNAAASAIAYERRDLSYEALDDLAADVDVLVHAAAVTPAVEDGQASDDLLGANLVPIVGLLGAARSSRRCARFLYVSSAGVYDQTQDRRLSEEHADGGTSLYGAAKLAAELVVHRYGRINGLVTASVRPTSLFGPGESPRPSRPRTTALLRLVEHALRDKPVAVEGLEARTDWLSVDDAAEAVVQLALHPDPGGRAFNLASSTPMRFSAIVEAVATVAGLRVEDDAAVVVAPGPDRPAVIDHARLAALVGWAPRRTVEDGIRDILTFLSSPAVIGGGS